jgi:hypothetical protein
MIWSASATADSRWLTMIAVRPRRACFRCARIRASVPVCPGDGNYDFAVNQHDRTNWRFYADTGGLSSVYDLNLDGFTDAADEDIIQANLGIACPP